MATVRPLNLRAPNLVFGVFVAGLLVLGAWLGYALAAYERLVPYKLLNIIGIVYGLLGIVVLAEFVMKSEPLKEFMVHWVAGLLLWAHTIVPFGVVIGAGVGHTLPSAGVTAKFFVSFFVYSLGVLALLESAVFNPRAARPQPLATRTHAFGLILLLSGVVAQLVAALQDFNG
jgi:hypothetical protein